MCRHLTLLRIVLCIVASLLLQGSLTRALAVDACDFAAKVCDTRSNTDKQDSTHSFESSSQRLALSTASQASQGIVPVVRILPRALRSMPRPEQSSAALRSIDSTTAAPRYGLYNHKILFYSHPRHYYLNGLMRLII